MGAWQTDGRTGAQSTTAKWPASSREQKKKKNWGAGEPRLRFPLAWIPARIAPNLTDTLGLGPGPLCAQLRKVTDLLLLSGSMVEGDTSGVSRDEITVLLNRAAADDPGARDALFSLFYEELHQRASALMDQQPNGHTLQPTALVGEMYLRLFKGQSAGWTDRRHFLLSAARAMRHVLVDHARRKSAKKRSGEAQREPLDLWLVACEERAVDLTVLDEVLTKLAEFDPEMLTAVELRLFGNASSEEAARALGMGQRTFERRWQAVRAWLYKELRS